MAAKGPEDGPKIAVVGPCAAGKTTLAHNLQAHGLRAKQIVQEHSFVPDMWQIMTDPDLLIYLDASFETCQRRKPLNWRETDYAEQQRRLRHAREHCDLYIETDGLSPEQVCDQALAGIQGLT